MERTELSARKKLILRTVVEAYIANGEPVGSKSVLENENISCSSATVRNEMAELAELGYLNGAADGNFGTGTQTAVKNFQKDNGLDSDGIAGRMTLEALYAKSSVTPLPDNTPTAAPGDIMDLPG